MSSSIQLENRLNSGIEGGYILTVKSICNHRLVSNRLAHLHIPEQLCKLLLMIGSRRLTGLSRGCAPVCWSNLVRIRASCAHDPE